MVWNYCILDHYEHECNVVKRSDKQRLKAWNQGFNNKHSGSYGSKTVEDKSFGVVCQSLLSGWQKTRDLGLFVAVQNII